MRRFTAALLILAIPIIAHAQVEIYGVELFKPGSEEITRLDYRQFDNVHLRYDSMSVYHEFYIHDSSVKGYLAMLTYLERKFGHGNRDSSAWDKFITWGLVSKETLFRWNLIDTRYSWTHKTPAGKVLLSATWSDDKGIRIWTMGWRPGHQNYN